MTLATVTAETVLVALALLNTAGILPALWAGVRYLWKTERRLLRIETKLGLADRRETD